MRKVVRSGAIAAVLAALVGWMYELGDGRGRSGAWPIAAAVFVSLWALFATDDLPKTAWHYRVGQSAYDLLVPAVLLAQWAGLLAHPAVAPGNASVLLLWMVVALVGRNRHWLARSEPFGPLVFRLIPDPPPNDIDPPSKHDTGPGT